MKIQNVYKLLLANLQKCFSFIDWMDFIFKKIIFCFGFSLAWTPRFILSGFCKILALVILILLTKRRILLLENLKSALPSFSDSKITLIAFYSVCRSIEQGLLVFAWPHLNKQKLVQMFNLDINNLNIIRNANSKSNGVIWLIPHFCHVDALSLLSSYIGVDHGIHALYRPLKNKIINNYVRESRERFGFTTIDRKDGGMLKTLKVLKKGKTLAMLFDQNAGAAGTKLPFMQRECSCTTLPDILYQKYIPNILFVYTRRTGFWSSSIEVEEMSEMSEGKLVIQKANDWLEHKLREDKVLRESWLWMHQRWKPGVGQPKKGKIR
jgi:lauroyl/myristoyl acyltransferase